MIEKAEYPNVSHKQQLGGATYYKVEEVAGIEKIVNHFRKLRDTGFLMTIKNKLLTTSFLNGVSGNALVFRVEHDWFDNTPSNDEKGLWIHQSLLFPFLCTSGIGSLHTMVTKFDELLIKSYKEEEENREFAMKIAEQNGEIDDLKATIKALEASSNPQEGTQMKLLEPPKVVGSNIIVNNRSQFTLAYINKAMRMANVQWGDSAKSRTVTYGGTCYSDAITAYLRSVRMIAKTDNYHYESPGQYGQLIYTYKPRRQDKAKLNKRAYPVQYYGLTQRGLQETILGMVGVGLIQPVNVVFKG